MKSMKRLPRGMLLLECLIAILIFSIGVLGLVMMQSIASGNSVNSEDRATAAALANDVISELWTNGLPLQIPSGDLSAWQTSVRGALPVPSGSGNDPTVSISGNTATVTIVWQAKNQDTSATLARYMTQVTIQ